MVDPTITEAKFLQKLAETNGAEISVSTGNLVAKAEERKKNGQTEEAYLLADEAILLLQISLLDREKKNIEDSLTKATETLRINRNLLAERKGAK
jgi:phage protein D